MNRKITEDYIGKKFGRLTIVGITTDNRGSKVYECKCSCGNKTKVSHSDIVRGHTQSCGCLHIESINKPKSHGMTGSRIYKIYKGMKQRCCNSNNPNYKDYGGRGIGICDSWLNSFENFYKWSMNNGYADNLTIDRIDTDKGYEPDNCRWASRKTQSRNLRSNKNLSYKGQIHTMSEWSEILNIPYTTIQGRLYRGWPVEKALSTPVERRKNE